MDVASGTVAITGPSGSGKSTLLRIIAGLQAPDSGEVAINSQVVPRPRSKGRVHPEVSFVGQNPELISFLTVGENIVLGGELRGVRISQDDVLSALSSVGLGGAVRKRPHQLSGGERQRIALARAVACAPSVLLADEPTASLDAKNALIIAELLHSLAAERCMTIIAATHDERVAEMMDSRITLLSFSDFG